MSIRHSKHAPTRFIQEVQPALLEYSNQSTHGIVSSITQAKQTIVARSDDDRQNFLRKQGFSAKQATTIINRVLEEEDTKPESIWDFVNGITATARNIKHTDDRIDMERIAGRLMDKVIH